MEFADAGLALFQEVTAKFPHHRKLSLIAMEAGRKKVLYAALCRHLQALPCRTAVEERHSVNLSSPRLQHALNFAQTLGKVKQMLERF